MVSSTIPSRAPADWAARARNDPARLREALDGAVVERGPEEREVGGTHRAVDELGAREHATWTLDENLQHGELGDREIDRLPFPANDEPMRIELERADAEDRLVLVGLFRPPGRTARRARPPALRLDEDDAVARPRPVDRRGRGIRRQRSLPC